MINRDPAHRYTDAEIVKLNSRLHEVYSEAYRDLDKKLKDFNERYRVKEAKYYKDLQDGKITQEQYNNWVKGQVFQGQRWQAKKDDIARTMYNVNTVAANIVNNSTSNVFIQNGNYIGYALEHGAGVSFGFSLYDQNTVSRLLVSDPQLLPEWKIDEPKDYAWNYKNVQNSILQGTIQGERLDQISNRIAKGLAMRNENTAKTFARTAMTGAQNAGRQTRLQEAVNKGLNVKKQWMATLDSHTRDSHADVDGEVVGVNEKFSNGLEYPGEPGGAPAEVYNCRCTMVGNLVEYPAEYKRYDNINGELIRNMSYREWENAKRAESKTGIKTKLPTPVEFKRDFDIAKSTLPKGGEWRVDDTYTVSDYEHKKLFELSGGSVVAIAEDGDIVSVCKNLDGDDVGSNLLKVAVANGGDRLDAFGEGLYKFYTKNGFEPVSWTPFNEEYAPHDWVKGRDNPEPVIFYRYTGNQTSTSYADFLSSVNSSAEYDDAKEIRNKLIADSK